MESIVVIGCPSCGRRYRFDTRRFGTSGVRVRCRSCETIMMVRVRSSLLETESESPTPTSHVVEHDRPLATPLKSGSDETEAVPGSGPSDPTVRVCENEKDTPSDRSAPTFEQFLSRTRTSPEDTSEEPSTGRDDLPLVSRTTDSSAAADEHRASSATGGETGTASCLEARPEEALEDTAADDDEIPFLPDPESAGPFESPEDQPCALVADRDADRRELFTQLLRNEGFSVLAADSGFEARRILATDRPRIAFLNAFLPDVLGVTLCSEIKRHPELSTIHVILVGSQYRRDRFVRDPAELYGADAFLDGSGGSEDVLRRARVLVRDVETDVDVPDLKSPDDLTALKRLARIIAGDIILYNPTTAEAEIAAGRFFETFAEEIREGETLVATRFPEIGDRESVFHSTLQEAVAQHGLSAGIPVGGVARDH